jgi:hypothetical protein
MEQSADGGLQEGRLGELFQSRFQSDLHRFGIEIGAG